MMPHEDGARRYWTADPRATAEAWAKLTGPLLKYRTSTNPAERAYFEAFVRPSLGPRPLVDSPYVCEPIYSFVDLSGEEIRVSATMDDDGSNDWEIERFTLGPDDLWYPVPVNLKQPLTHASLLAETAGFLLRSIQRTILEPRLVVGRVKGGRRLDEWYLLSLSPRRGTIHCTVEPVLVSPPSSIDFLRNAFTISSGDLPQLLLAGQALAQSIPKLRNERLAAGKPFHPATEDVDLKIEEIPVVDYPPFQWPPRLTLTTSIAGRQVDG